MSVKLRFNLCFTCVLQIEVEDVDSGDTISMELEAVDPEEVNATALFSLDKTTGIMRTLAVLDTEEKDVYSLIGQLSIFISFISRNSPFLINVIN